MPSNLLLGNPLQSYNEGVQIGNQNRFNALAGQAVSATGDQRASLISQAAQADPRQAIALSGALTQQDDTAEDRRNKTMVNMSRMLLSVPESQRDQIYQRMRPQLASFGLSQVPDVYTPEVAQTAQSIVDAWTPANATPAGFREFQAQAAAAGLKPGTPEYQRAAKVALGTEGRASNAGMAFQKITGADGRERIARQNPRTGAVEIYDETTGDFTPLGAMSSPAPAPAAGAGVPQLNGSIQYQPTQPAAASPAADANALLSQGVEPNEIAARISAKYGQQLGGRAPALEFVNGRFTDGATGGTPAPLPTNPALAVSRTPEETARATQDAKNASDLAVLPQTEDIKTRAAIAQAGGAAAASTAAKNQAEQAQTFQQRQADARKTLSDLDEVDRLLPKATGGTFGKAIDSAAASLNHSTDTSKASAQLDILAGRLTSAVPRMQGPQSDRDVELYQKQAGDLANRSLPIGTRQSAANELRRLQLKYLDNPYGNGSPVSGTQVNTRYTPEVSGSGNFTHLWN